MRAVGGAVMEPHGESVLKAGGRGVRGRNSGGSLGQVVKAGSADSKVDKPSSADSAREGWIYVRGHRLKKAGLHIYCHGTCTSPTRKKRRLQDLSAFDVCWDAFDVGSLAVG